MTHVNRASSALPHWDSGFFYNETGGYSIMPRNKKEGIVYTVMEVIMMTLFMGINTMATFTVVFMSAYMVLFGAMFLNGFSISAVDMFRTDWPLFFVIALAWQWIVAGPVGRRLLGLKFKSSRVTA